MKEEATGSGEAGPCVREHRLAARPPDHHTGSFLCHGAVRAVPGESSSISGPPFLHQLPVNDSGISSP